MCINECTIECVLGDHFLCKKTLTNVYCYHKVTVIMNKQRSINEKGLYKYRTNNEKKQHEITNTIRNVVLAWINHTMN